MKRVAKWFVLGTGALLASIVLAIYGQAAIQTIAGLAVAQTATQWNNLKDTAFGDNMTNGVMAAGCVLFDGTNSDRCRGDTTNGLDVDVTRVTGSITVVGNNTPSDNYANPTDAVDANALISGWDGSTWDRLLTSTHGDNVTTTAGLNVASILYGFDGTNYDRLRSGVTNADDIAVLTTGVLSTQTFLYGWDGTTWDRFRTGGTGADGESTFATGFFQSDAHLREFNGTTYDRVRSQFTQSTTGVTTNAAGTTVTMTTTPMNNYTMVIDRTAGSTNPVEVDIQCSLDGSIWVQIGTITDLTNEPVLTSVTGNPCAAMRYNVVTVGSGNTLTIQLLATR